MILQPASRGELPRLLREISGAGGAVSGYDMSRVAALVQHAPEDMTATVEAGMSLAAFQGSLRSRGQWLPIDPPFPEDLSIGALLAANPSGPRRFGYGTIREHLIGIRVALADGRLIKAGGNVVKNVAGYDLCKLFVGSHGALGCIVEATFKLRPLPESERFVKTSVESLSRLGDLIERTQRSGLNPTVLDVAGKRGTAPEIIIGFDGSPRETEWQAERAASFGISTPTDLAHESEFWSAPGEVRSASTLPSKLHETLPGLDADAFVARVGAGRIHFRGGRPPDLPQLPSALLKRMKEAYDPNGVLPVPTWLQA